MVGLGKRVGTLVASAMLAGTLAARAEPARLAWSAPAPCPPESALRVEVARLLGAAAFEQGGFEARASVTANEAPGFTLVLWVRAHDSEGTRTVRAETCGPLLDVAAFSIALAVNPELSAQQPPTVTDERNPEPPPTESGPPVSPPRPAAAVVPPPPRSSEPPSARAHTPPPPPPELWVGARLVGDTSLLPGPALGLGLGADVLLLGALRFGVGAQVFLPQEERLASEAGGLFTLWALEGHACYDFSLPVRVAVCPLVEFGFVHGEGRGVEPRLDQSSTLVAPGAMLAGRFRLMPRLAAMLGTTVLFPLSRDQFVVKSGQVHEIPAVSVEALVGLELRVD